MTQLLSIPTLVVLVASVAASVTDIWRFKVYNVLTLPLLATGIAFHWMTGGRDGCLDSVVGMSVGFGLLIYPYLMGALGAGDVKFVAAIGAWLGVQPMLPVIVIGCIAAGIYSLVVLAIHGGFRQAWINMKVALLRLTLVARQLGAEDEIETVQDLAGHDARRRRLVPFSAMMSVGILVTCLRQLFG